MSARMSQSEDGGNSTRVRAGRYQQSPPQPVTQMHQFIVSVSVCTYGGITIGYYRLMGVDVGIEEGHRYI